MARKKATPKKAKAQSPEAQETQAQVLEHGTPKDVPHAPDQNVEKRKWTRKEAEQSIRERAFRCAGPLLPDQVTIWQAHMDAGRMDEARATITRGLNPVPGVFVPCNQDLVEEILSRPFDGSDQERTCPHCGTLNTWRQPIFAGLED